MFFVKVKAKRIKKNYGKELAELHHHPATTEEDDEERDTFPDASHPRMSRRASKVTKHFIHLHIYIHKYIGHYSTVGTIE